MVATHFDEDDFAADFADFGLLIERMRVADAHSIVVLKCFAEDKKQLVLAAAPQIEMVLD